MVIENDCPQLSLQNKCLKCDRGDHIYFQMVCYTDENLFQRLKHSKLIEINAWCTCWANERVCKVVHVDIGGSLWCINFKFSLHQLQIPYILVLMVWS